MQFCGVCDGLLRIKLRKGIPTYHCRSCRKFKPWRKIKESTITNVYTNEENHLIEVDEGTPISKICAQCRKEFSDTIGKTTQVSYTTTFGHNSSKSYSMTQNTRFCSVECRTSFKSNH